MTDAAKGATGPDATPPSGAREPNDTIRTIPPEPRGPGKLASNRALLSREAIEALAGAAERNARDCAIILILYSSGLRAGEVRGLRVGDITSDENGSCWAAVRPCKRSRPTTVPVVGRAAKAIRQYLEGRGCVEDEDPLFADCDGSGLSDVALRKIVRKYADAVRENHPDLLVGARVTPAELRRAGIVHAFVDGEGSTVAYRFGCNRRSRDDISCYLRDEDVYQAAAERLRPFLDSRGRSS